MRTLLLCWISNNFINNVLNTSLSTIATAKKTKRVHKTHSIGEKVYSSYRIACNFRGAKYSWFSWLEVWPRIFYPRMKRPCLPLPAVQAPTTKILPTKCINIAEPRIFCPPKIAHYKVYQLPFWPQYMYMYTSVFVDDSMSINPEISCIRISEFYCSG